MSKHTEIIKNYITEIKVLECMGAAKALSQRVNALIEYVGENNPIGEYDLDSVAEKWLTNNVKCVYLHVNDNDIGKRDVYLIMCNEEIFISYSESQSDTVDMAYYVNDADVSQHDITDVINFIENQYSTAETIKPYVERYLATKNPGYLERILVEVSEYSMNLPMKYEKEFTSYIIKNLDSNFVVYLGAGEEDESIYLVKAGSLYHTIACSPVLFSGIDIQINRAYIGNTKHSKIAQELYDKLSLAVIVNLQ